MGRELQKKCDQAPQQVVLMKPLVGLDGERKMSSSYGNYIGLTESAGQMFGKIMSIRDEQTAAWAELAAWMDADTVGTLRSLHPRDAKIRVAQATAALYYGSEQAEQAAVHFAQTFGKKEVSNELAEPIPAPADGTTLGSLVAQAAGVSNSEAARLIGQGAVRIDGQTFSSPTDVVQAHPGQVLQVGKHRFFRLQ
jgi:tyrosyl-tRNA synthetase